MSPRRKTIRSSASDVWQVALRLLSRRDHSRAELRAKLQQRGFTEDDVTAALERATRLGYLDDSRFAHERARTLARQGKTGGRLAQELQRSGLSEQLIGAAMSAADEDFPREQVLRDLLRRRYSDFDYHSATDKERGRVIRFFQRRGFPLSLVITILKEER